MLIASGEGASQCSRWIELYSGLCYFQLIHVMWRRCFHLWLPCRIVVYVLCSMDINFAHLLGHWSWWGEKLSSNISWILWHVWHCMYFISVLFMWGKVKKSKKDPSIISLFFSKLSEYMHSMDAITSVFFEKGCQLIASTHANVYIHQLFACNEKIHSKDSLRFIVL